MREILFRGKRLDNGEWVEGWFCEAPFSRWPLLPSIIPFEKARRGCFVYIEVDPESVGQFTGLKDKSGVRIFEDDIVEHHAQGNIIVNRGVVKWDEKCGRWAHQLKTMKPDFTFFNPDAWEVIGNIHDNPELLEVEK